MNTLPPIFPSENGSAPFASPGAFEKLKRIVRGKLTKQFPSNFTEPLAERAVDEAARILQAVGFCHLFLPALAEERARRILTVATARENDPSLPQVSFL